MRSVSQRESISLGTLLSRVLPFTEETPSNDQSNVCDDLCDHSFPEVKDLRNAAVEIRRLIRVKMADENDFKQVTLS